ncbi:hypothetical protein CRYUN_Cryun32bG0048300 [Craigia yunnanensis]
MNTLKSFACWAAADAKPCASTGPSGSAISALKFLAAVPEVKAISLSHSRLKHGNLGLNLNLKENRYEIVQGEHSLWEGVSKPYRETIRAFLAYFQNEILRPNESFCFSNGGYFVFVIFMPYQGFCFSSLKG